MNVTLEMVYKKLTALEKEIAEMKKRLDEEYELSEHASGVLKNARNTPESEYVELE